jgi:hypothetical protein
MFLAFLIKNCHYNDEIYINSVNIITKLLLQRNFYFYPQALNTPPIIPLEGGLTGGEKSLISMLLRQVAAI